MSQAFDNMRRKVSDGCSVALRFISVWFQRISKWVVLYSTKFWSYARPRMNQARDYIWQNAPIYANRLKNFAITVLRKCKPYAEKVGSFIFVYSKKYVKLSWKLFKRFSLWVWRGIPVGKRFTWKRVLFFSLKGVGITACSIVLFIFMVKWGVFGHLHTQKELSAFHNQTASLVYDSDKNLIGKFYQENRTNLTYEQFPKNLVNALIATEDIRFFEHSGVDLKSMLRVLVKSIILQKSSSGGGSTITQQLVKNMYGRGRYGPLTMAVNKTKEALMAYRIENVYSKEEIITLYLNTIPFGENVFGIEAASLRYFNHSAKQLSIEESALLVGMLKANTQYNPRLNPKASFKRRNEVLGQMKKYGYLGSTTFDSLRTLPIKLDYANFNSEGPANYFLVEVKKEAQDIIAIYNKEHKTNLDVDKDGLMITTTIDMQLQQAALKGYKKHLKTMQGLLRQQYASGKSKRELGKMIWEEIKEMKAEKRAQEKKTTELFSWDGFYTDSLSLVDSLAHILTLLHAGQIGLDPNTGEVKCWVGGIHFHTQPYDQVIAKRQLASTFKPILYASAIQNGFSPCYMLDNDSLIFEEFENWSPENYSKTTGGKYSLKGALINSKNIPTVNLYTELGYDPLNRVWKAMGFTNELHSSPSVALGTAEANTLELAAAYASFANGGFAVKPTCIERIEDAEGHVLYQRQKPKAKRILKPQVARYMSAILQQAVNRGTGTAMKKKYGVWLPIAGKTGTSQNFADAWFVGFTPKLVLVGRVGAANPGIHFNTGKKGSGSALALPLVAQTYAAIQSNSALKKQYARSFKPLSQDEADNMLCPDYEEEKEENDIFNLFEFFRKRKAEKARRDSLEQLRRTSEPSRRNENSSREYRKKLEKRRKKAKRKRRKKRRKWKKKHF